MDIQLGYWRWKIYRWNEHPNPFRGRHDLALEWLRRLSNNGMAMPELRSLLERAGLGVSNRPDDQHVLEEVAARLSSGEFQVCAESSHPFHSPEAKVVPPDASAAAVEALEAITQAPPPPAATAAPAAASPAPSPLAQPAQESTLSQNADPAAIAPTGFDGETPRTLVTATFSDTVDAAAIAVLMKKAAEEGLPFCEECERAKRRQEAAARQGEN